MPATRRTTQLLDDLDDHIDAACDLRDGILDAMADGQITPTERRSIVHLLHRTAVTVEPLPVHAASIDTAMEVIGSFSNTGGFTAKVDRTLRERRADIVRLEAVRDARLAAFELGPEAA